MLTLSSFLDLKVSPMTETTFNLSPLTSILVSWSASAMRSTWSMPISVSPDDRGMNRKSSSRIAPPIKIN